MRRRDFLAGVTATGAALAGCSGGTDGESTTEDGGETSTETPESTDAPTNTATETPEPTETETGPYSVTMEPVGTVEFESVPETWLANNGSWADMGAALGLEPPEGVWLTRRYHTQYYDDIPGVSVDKSDMVSLSQSGSVSKEQFYDIDADVHVVDPNFLMNRFDRWDQSDITDVRENVGPVFGNSSFSTGYPWHSDYRYYSVMEAFEKLAQVFQRTDRYEAFEAVRDEFQSNLAPVVPVRGERPPVAVLWGLGNEPAEFLPYTVGDGTSFAHLRTLGVRDAMAESDVQDFHSERAAIDFETLLEVDPPVLLLRGYEGMGSDEFRDTVVGSLEDDSTGSALTAVRNGDVYRAGGLYQGPITNMVLTERLAGDLYDFDGDLFDRERVAEIANGDL
ncbi:Fe3+-hydroxamate ABC transporter substrate-binding protein [Halobacteriales archaeon SW_7_68_16]|nr:MAG: Fe3+-hydroxamate ABC transporter substrate-binding protein [Halobacteriales archaeon SW_7_68_16]